VVDRYYQKNYKVIRNSTVSAMLKIPEQEEVKDDEVLDQYFFLHSNK
jgi:hypothetical protein